MRDLRADVDGTRPALERIHEFGKGFPFPGQSVGEDNAGNLFHPFHQVHKRRAMLGAHRRETHPAVSENNRAHPVPARRRKERIPDRLPVIVSVHVHPSGGDQEPIRVDLPARRRVPAADLDNTLAGNADISGEARLAGAIDDGPAANDDVVHEASPGAQPARKIALKR